MKRRPPRLGPAGPLLPLRVPALAAVVSWAVALCWGVTLPTAEGQRPLRVIPGSPPAPGAGAQAAGGRAPRPAVSGVPTDAPAVEPDRRAAPSGCPVADADLRAVTAVLERWADRTRTLSDVPGLALGLACGAGWTWHRGFGHADPAGGLAATDTTLFRIASITKVFTAIAVLQLRDEGRLNLDDPVAEHLPWFRLRNSDTLPPVTVRHLLTHTSGLPTNSSATDFNRMTQPAARRAKEALGDQSLVFPPGARFKYSNLGFAVLGQLVAAASGRPYGRYLEERVLAPLELRRTVAHPSAETPQAVGHHLRIAGRPRRPADFLHLGFFTPAGGMATTAGDMVRFLSFLLHPEPDPATGRRPVLEPATLEEMEDVHHRTDSAGGGSGLAWAVEKRPGVHVIYHGGGLPTQASHLRVDLEANLGVIVLTNAEDARPGAYAREALSLLRLASGAGSTGGRRPGPESEEAGGGNRGDGEVTTASGGGGASPAGAGPAAGGDDAAGVPARDGSEGSPQSGGCAPRPPGEEGRGLRRYTGRYRFQEREIWAVVLCGRLALLDPTEDRPSSTIMWLTPRRGHRFRVERGWPAGETAEFVVEEASGDVLRLHLPALVYHRVGSVTGGH